MGSERVTDEDGLTFPMGYGDLYDEMTDEVLDARAASLRHSLRNRLSAIRNAVYYLMRKSEPTQLWENDERISSFFQLIDDELERCTQHISDELNAAGIRQFLE